MVAAFQVGRRDRTAASNIGTDDLARRRPNVDARLPARDDGERDAAGPETAASDPSVAYDSVHGVWLVSTLTIEQGGGSHVYVALDRRRELVAAGRRGVRSDADKNWIACDNGARALQGRCYLEYTDDELSTT